MNVLFDRRTNREIAFGYLEAKGAEATPEDVKNTWTAAGSRSRKSYARLSRVGDVLEVRGASQDTVDAVRAQVAQGVIDAHRTPIVTLIPWFAGVAGYAGAAVSGLYALGTWAAKPLAGAACAVVASVSYCVGAYFMYLAKDPTLKILPRSEPPPPEEEAHLPSEAQVPPSTL